MFTETQRDIIANNQQYNNRFNYAVSVIINMSLLSKHFRVPIDYHYLCF